MIDLPLDEIDEDALNGLINDAQPERRIIEYKLVLPSDTYDSKKEFLADTTSFANASGGHLIYGIREEEGIALDVPGITDIDPDNEILRFENLMRDGIDPRLSGVSIKSITLKSGTHAIVLRIPRSWAGPHVVRYRRHWRFYSRNSAGKYPLDVGEVRSAFLRTEVIQEKIKSLRDIRLGSIISGETPIPIIPGARIILHLIPFVSFEPAANFPISRIADDPWNLKPIYNSVTSYRHNFDGFLTYGGDENGLARGYVQVFRNGVIEAVDAGIIRVRNGDHFIPSVIIERELVAGLKSYLANQLKIDVMPPISILATLVGVSGYYLAVKRSLDPWGEHSKPIDRDTLLLPEVIVESFQEEPPSILRPIFDAIWNSTGWPRSLNYDDDGEWPKGINWRS